jgi:hypothetical protein
MVHTRVLSFLAAMASPAIATLPGLPTFLTETSNAVFPDLKTIAVDIFNHPELALEEHRAHDLITNHFSALGDWAVTPHFHGLDTAFELVFEHRPDDFDGPLETIGFFAEYDALVIGHACGHNHIALVGMTSPLLAAKALIEYDVPGRIKVVGTPDEENGAGKAKLEQAGAFDDADVWMMAHPTATSAIQPMNARLNIFPLFTGGTHQEAVKKAYQAMVVVDELAGSLPGTASTASTILNIGAYAVNVVQSEIGFGIAGVDSATVDSTLSSILDDTFPGVSYTIAEDSDGTAIEVSGPGGHASEATKGALELTIEAFRAFSDDASVSFYLPGNTSFTELEITVDIRTRFTTNLAAIADHISYELGDLWSSLGADLAYPSLEVPPVLGQTMIDLLSSPDYGLTDWKISDFAPASTDASWVQSATVDSETHELLSMKKVVFHPNYRICGTGEGDLCAFNHEPLFREVAGSDYSYTQTEIVARALAQIAVELFSDEQFYDEVTAIVHP